MPLFLFLSGYLLLGRDYSKAENVWKFWKNKFVPLLLTFEIWTVINQIFEALLYNMEMDFISLVKRLLFIQGSQFGHMWYMPMILGIYLMIPFIGGVLQRFPLKIFLIPMIMCFIYYFIVSDLNIVVFILGGSAINTNIYLDFTGGGGLYLICGYVCKKIIEYIDNSILKKTVYYILAMITGIMFIATVIFQMWSYSCGYVYNVWYNFGMLFICTVAMFLLFGISKGNIKLNKVWNKLSEASFGIYYIHNLVVSVLLRNGILESVNRPLRVVLVVGIVMLSSLCVEEVIAKIFPRASKVLFLRKKI